MFSGPISSESIRRQASLILLCLAAVIFTFSGPVSSTVWAQDSNSTISVEAPDITVASLTADKAEVNENEELTEDEKTQIQELYDTAITRLRNAEKNLETAKAFERELTESPRIVEQLRNDLALAREPAPDEPEDAPMEGSDLIKLEQELIAQESKLRGLRAEVDRYTSQLETLLQRPVTARDQMAEARTRLSEVNTQIESLNGQDLSPEQQARLAAFVARRYFRQAEILALEQEAGGRVARQDILTLRRDIAQAKADKTARRVAYIQRKTGQSRLNEAAKVHQSNVDSLAALETPHPFVTDLAKGNISYSQGLKDAAGQSSRFPRLEAEARDQLKIVNSDFAVADQLIDLGNLDRESSKTLRRLRDKGLSPNAIKADMEKTKDAIVRATQDRLLALEELREISGENFNILTEVADWKSENAEAPPLTEIDMGQAQKFYEARRDLLSNISRSATNRYEDLLTLETSQAALLAKTEELKELLDQNLLWLPSVPAVGPAWFGRTARGMQSVFSPDHLAKVAQIPLRTAPRMIPILVIFAILILSAFYVRPRLVTDIKTRAKYVGRVQKDSYWHTPTVILACALIALPVPLILWAASLIYKSSGSVDPFIIGLGNALSFLAIFTMFFLTWVEWNRDQSLFDVHYKLPGAIRRGVYRQFRWFIPVVGIASAMIIVTESIPEPDVYEGVSVLAFIISALAITVFAFKVFWAKRGSLEALFKEGSTVWRYRKPIMAIMMGLPAFAALLAASGYYETASELLNRLFFSGCLLVATYVVYGLVRRSIMVAQRRLHLRQAIERRDKALKARQEKEEAEERGEILPPPQVDYEEIDVESMSRQTSQLLYTAMAIGFAVLMWVIWSDLLPALSSLNDVNLYDYMASDSEGNPIELNVTLWSVIQVAVIIFLTYIAAKNLPGFLEIFVLNKAGVDAGTRYAIVTILGYIIVAIGILMAIDRLGLEWSKLQWLVAGLGVGIGFGLQEIIANFISGLIILFERPVRIGDYVTIGDQSGTVSRIQIRAITISDLDSRETLIPNKELITGRVTNWTLSSTVTRIKIPVGVAYGSDTEKVHGIIMDVLKQQSTILKDPGPQAMFLGFGDSSLDFEIRVFIKSMDDRFPVQHSIHTDLNKAFEKAGISIPFPQRDLHVITQKVPEALVTETPKAKPKAKAKAKTKPKPKTT